MPQIMTSALAEYTIHMSQVDIVDSIDGLPGVDTLEGRIGPIMSGNLGSAHYITMPPGMYCTPHTHSTESIIFTPRGQWVLCSEGQRHHMREGSIYFMPPDIETGYEVPFDAPATLLIMKFEGPMDADGFLDYLDGLRGRLEDQHDSGEPFQLSELPENHDARTFAASLGRQPA
ncbi:MAG: AraC family ligand binding domain-containing protein [Coriobacteriia bacterium]|nr:AraC family ligand binding domain-containing protein [Coriobacteriia bacterium]